MTTPPQGWVGDPAVDAGFAAAYAPAPAPALAAPAVRRHVPVQPVATSRDEADLQADLAARRLMADGRRVRAPEPGRLAPARALRGAAVSLAGVCLGIGTLLWVSGEPAPGPGQAASESRPLSSATVETEAAPVAPPPAPPVPAAAPLAPAPPGDAPEPVAPAPVVPAAAPAPAAPAPAVVPITVLNNSNRTGLADRAAARFERGGWPVRLTGNFRGQIPVTTVYYDAGSETAARAFARDFDGIARVRPRFETLPARGVVVVLTREFGA